MDPPILVDLGGTMVAVTTRRSGRARRLSVRIDPAAGPVVVLPRKTSLEAAERFLVLHRIWLAERLARLPPRVPLTAGAAVPILGVPHEIRPVPAARRGVWTEPGLLFVSGREEHLPRRVRDFLKAEAARHIRPRAFALAAGIGRLPCRLTLRDTTSRWGSCSTRGDLSFSWRLVMAPESVLTYVVAHEVAHLVEMNHSPAFWNVVAALAGDPGPARTWLKANGAALHRYGS